MFHRERGETLTADALNEKYLALNGSTSAPDMVSDDEIALEWARAFALLLQLLCLPV